MRRDSDAKPIGESESASSPPSQSLARTTEAGGWMEYELQPIGKPQHSLSNKVDSTRCGTPIPSYDADRTGLDQEPPVFEACVFPERRPGPPVDSASALRITDNIIGRIGFYLRALNSVRAWSPQSPSDCDVHDASRRESHEQTPIRSAVAHRQASPHAE